MNLVKLLHQFRFLRLIAKKLAKNFTIKQRFYQGTICLNAVEHSWAWTGNNKYETFDREFQDALYHASFTHDLLIDIGANIGVMTIGTLLHNSTINTIAVDPNTLATKLLNQTLLLNKLTHRCQVINAAVGIENGFIGFDESGSVTGHISSKSKKIKQLKLAEFLNQNNHQQKTLVKIDVEGYEALLVEDFKEITNIANYTFFIEVHALGFNGIGNPEKVFSAIKEIDGVMTDLKGVEIINLLPEMITQIIVKFSAG